MVWIFRFQLANLNDMRMIQPQSFFDFFTDPKEKHLSVHNARESLVTALCYEGVQSVEEDISKVQQKCLEC